MVRILESRFLPGRNTTSLCLALFLAGGVCACFVGQMISSTWVRNDWSLHAMRVMLVAQGTSVDALLPPVGHPRAKTWQAMLALKRGETETAVRLIAEDGDLAKDPIEAWVLGEVYRRGGNLSSAIEVWQGQKAWHSLMDVGFQAMDSQKYEEAVQIFQVVQELQPDKAVLPLALAYVALGRASYASGKGADVALAQINEGIGVMPGLIDGYLAKGDILQQERRYLEADSWYQQAVIYFPDNPKPWVRRGENAMLNEDTELAIRTLEQAAAQFPGAARVQYSLANAYFEARDPGKAVAAIEKALALAPDESAW